MICSNCGTENPAGRKFCGGCGQPLALACPQCGAPNEGRFQFCGECGSPLPSAGLPTSGRTTTSTDVPRDRPVAERRLVSVLFADLVGFTSLSETRDPDEVRDLLSRYFDACRQLISRYGGTVEKFIGDAVMAVWGAPIAQEDDAERAVRAAIDLIEAVHALGVEVGAPDLQARAGVLTGEAAVTLGAENEGMVAGDLVNTASRIQSVAPPGSVFVGEGTRRSTEAAVAYEKAGLHELKGKAEPVPLWRAVRVIGGRGGALRSEGLEAPFVGRDRELRLVKELFHSSADEGRAHLVSVIGVGGIGKSRLAWEFYKYIDGLRDTIWWHRGRCLSYGEGVTYWALAEMVRGRAGILEGEGAASAQEKLHAAVEQHLSDPEERSWVEPRLAHLLGLEDRTARDPEDLFSAWRLFFERLADQQPTIMVFEDMQWADPSLLDFIDYLLNWSRSHPLFVMALARPEFADRHPRWAGAARGMTTMYLEPLSPADMENLLSGLVPGLPPTVRDKILARAEGVPLYAVETVRMLLDRGLLVQDQNAYSLTGPLEDLEVPETLHALIAARLDGLPAAERALVQDASVLGKSFSKASLSSVTGLAETELTPVLSSLVRKEMLSVQADPRSPERGQYGFLQDLVRKVAYETLSRKERKARHLAAAAYLESAWGAEEEEIVEVVASHYVEAYRAVPDAPDAGEIKAKAREALVQAGKRSASLAASEEARRYFEQAIELADEPLERADLHERAGVMAWAASQILTAAEHYELAIAGFESEGQTHAAARVVARRADIAFGDGKLEEAVARMEQAWEVMSQEQPDEDLATLASQLGRLLFFVGRADEAYQRVELALELAETLGLPEVFSQALNNKSMVLNSRARTEEATVLLQHALKVAMENELHSAALRAYNNLAASWLDADRLNEAIEANEGGIELARRVGHRRFELKLLAGMAGPLVLAGRWDEALARVEEVESYGELAAAEIIAIELIQSNIINVHRGDLETARRRVEELTASEADAIEVRAVFATARAAVLLGEGRHEEALAVAQQSLDAAREVGFRSGPVKEATAYAMEAALALGNTAWVEEWLSTVEGLRPGQVTPSLRATTLRFRARLAALRGDHDSVPRGFKSAAGLFRQIGMPFRLAVTLLEHGEWLIGQGRSVEADPLLGEARGIFDGLRAAPWLARVPTAHRAVGEVSAGAPA